MMPDMQFLKKNKFIIIFLILSSFFYSCNEKEKTSFYQNIVVEDDFSYEIKVPQRINKNKSNYIEINNFKSKFDNDKNRYGIIYILIENQNIIDNAFQIDKQNQFKYYEDDLFNTTFLIPNSLFENKKGIQKLTIIILDIKLKDVNENSVNENIDISYIESREHYDVFID